MHCIIASLSFTTVKIDNYRVFRITRLRRWFNVPSFNSGTWELILLRKLFMLVVNSWEFWKKRNKTLLVSLYTFKGSFIIGHWKTFQQKDLVCYWISFLSSWWEMSQIREGKQRTWWSVAKYNSDSYKWCNKTCEFANI